MLTGIFQLCLMLALLAVAAPRNSCRHGRHCSHHHRPHGKPHQEPYKQSDQQPYLQPFQEPFQQPFQEPFHQPFQEPFQQPFQEPFQQPFQEPFQQPFQEPFQQPFQEPFQQPHELRNQSTFSHPRQSPDSGQFNATHYSMGNCKANNGSLTGRCMRFLDCKEAVHTWRQQHIDLESCNGTSNRHLVCCPQAVVEDRSMPQLQSSKSKQACLLEYNRRPIRGRPSLRHRRENKKMDSHTLVVGGRPTLRDEHPYMCALGWRSPQNSIIKKDKNSKYIYRCGCVLIARRFVLTAGHCINIGGESPIMALIGGVSLNDSRQSANLMKIKRITPHPEYDEQTTYNDVAVIELEKNSNHRPACLWTDETVPKMQLTAMGYGQTAFAGPSSQQLLQVDLYGVDNQRCISSLKDFDKLEQGIRPGQLCAGDYSGEMDTCQGDSGGPLIYKQKIGVMQVPYLIGLTSFGGICASGEPGIYARISHYAAWIEQQVWKS